MTKKHTSETDFINGLLWFIYILLLLVLLPHTSWMFARAEPDAPGLWGIPWGQVTAWSAATVFELVIAAMTHKLARHIANTPRYNDSRKRFRARYVNAYGAGLFLAWLVSTYANLAHAVEFGQPIKIFADWGLPAWTYSLAFGAILPTASLLFAWVLSSVIEQDATEGQANPDLDRAKEAVRKLEEQLRHTEEERRYAEQRANEAELRFAAAGDLFVKLMDGPKKERVLLAANRWPQLPNSAIAIITETSPSYVSEILTENEVER